MKSISSASCISNMATLAIIGVLAMSAGPNLLPMRVLAQVDSDRTETTPKTATVSIPRGAANPEIDLTLQNVANWYEPKKMTIAVGDTVAWKNQDMEPHTVTSGLGAGIQSVQTNEKGKPDGMFDSGIIKPEKGWSRIFYNPGTYNYFCTIHPWMEGLIMVSPVQATQLPAFPVDSSGTKQESWPVHTFSKDGKYDIDLKWDPVPILTGETATFFAEFYLVPSNVRPQPTPYEFVLLQDGKELDRVYSLTDVGVGIHQYSFIKAGQLTIRIENVGGDSNSNTEFSTIVYPNPAGGSDGTSAAGADAIRVGGTQPASRLLNPLTLVWLTYGIIFSLPAAAAVIVILFKKGKI